MLCNNCNESHTNASFLKPPCVLHALLAVAIEGDHCTVEQAQDILDRIAADAVWMELGDLTDRILAGEFSLTDEELGRV